MNLTHLIKTRGDVFLIGALLVAANFSLFTGGPSHSVWFFTGDNLLPARWWTCLGYIFAHVSLYHLILDAAAFSLLYSACWIERGPLSRLGMVAGGALGGAWAAWLAYPALNTTGLGGLSGVAHGLCGLVCLDLLRNPTAERSTKHMAAAGFLLLLGKAVWEAWTGDVMLAGYHAGDLGSPVAVSHAGGLLGFLLADVLHANTTKRTCPGLIYSMVIWTLLSMTPSAMA